MGTKPLKCPKCGHQVNITLAERPNETSSLNRIGTIDSDTGPDITKRSSVSTGDGTGIDGDASSPGVFRDDDVLQWLGVTPVSAGHQQTKILSEAKSEIPSTGRDTPVPIFDGFSDGCLRALREGRGGYVHCAHCENETNHGIRMKVRAECKYSIHGTKGWGNLRTEFWNTREYKTCHYQCAVCFDCVRQALTKSLPHELKADADNAIVNWITAGCGIAVLAVFVLGALFYVVLATLMASSSDPLHQKTGWQSLSLSGIIFVLVAIGVSAIFGIKHLFADYFEAARYRMCVERVLRPHLERLANAIIAEAPTPEDKWEFDIVFYPENLYGKVGGSLAWHGMDSSRNVFVHRPTAKFVWE